MSKLSYPKVLIISHNLYDNNNNIGKTLVSLFEGWPKNKLAQLYFRNDKPTFQYCEEYYCITDKEVFRSVITLRKNKAGRALSKNSILHISATEESLYQVGNYRKPIVSLSRDLMWELSGWKTNALNEWLKNIAKPDVILFVPNDYCLAYNIALYVIQFTHKPVIPFYMDDSFYWNCKTSILDNFRRKQLRKLAKKIHEKTNNIMTICNDMSKEYALMFNKPCTAFVNSVPIKEIHTKKKKSKQLIISYLGNIHSNRWKSIVEIGRAVDNIMNAEETKVKFRIFSNSFLEKKAKQAFDKIACIEFLGGIPASEVREQQVKSDILIHVEAFDRKSINSTRLSLSTKIPEYLSTGVCIFAYGPAEIASIRYLQENILAQICTKPADLTFKLKEIIMNCAKRKYLAENGYKQAKQFHDITKVSEKFQNLIIENGK